jgi:hypothetical protein
MLRSLFHGKLFALRASAVRKPALVELNDENAKRTTSAACTDAHPNRNVASQIVIEL